MELLLLVVIVGMIFIASIAIIACLLFSMKVDKHILEEKERSNSWVDKMDKRS